MTLTLDPGERQLLALANRVLTQLTDAHHHACECQLCEARWRTDVQDPDCGTIPGVVLWEELDTVVLPATTT